MINQHKKDLAERANTAINEELRTRIPYYREIRTDDSPVFVHQSDIFGYIDTVTQMSSERLYHNQNKSRTDSREDICIECRSFRGDPQNLNTGETSPIAGAHWCQTWNRWLSPRFGQADTITVYIPKNHFVGHYCRYFLEILFSKAETWKHVNSIFHKETDLETYLVFINYKKFNTLYLETVVEVTCGTGIITISPDNSSNIQTELEVNNE